MMRHVWAILFFAGLGGFFLAVEIGGYTKKHGMDDAPDPAVADLLGKPLVLAGIAIAIAAAYAIVWALSAKLEGGADWIGRLRPKPTQIHVSEAVRVKRWRGAKSKQTSATVSEMAFSIETADGRKIHVSEAGVHRRPKELMPLYEQALAAAITHAGQALSAGHPLQVDGYTTVFHDRFENPFTKTTVLFRDVAFVLVQIGTRANVGAYTAQGKRIRELPDDQMMLLMLPMLGVKTETVRVAH